MEMPVQDYRNPHGIIETPAFIPVGTKATVKSLTPSSSAMQSARKRFSLILIICIFSQALKS